MTHLTSEELILHHYGEGDDAADATAHLAACPECQHDLARLRRTLAAADLPVPERGDDYGVQVWERLRGRLPRRRRFTPSRIATWGALAASILLAFLVGRQTAPAPQGFSGPVRERILLVAVGDHLERSRMVLAELVATPGDGPADIRSEQQWAQALVSENHLYRQTVQRSGDAALVSVLDDLERVLVEVANGPSELSVRQLKDIRERIESKGILFKVRVVGRKVRERARQAPADRTKTTS